MADGEGTLDLFDAAPEPEPAAPVPAQRATARRVAAEAPPEAGRDRADEAEVWTVSQVNRAVRKLLEGTLPPVWVSGEVGGWKRARSGHCYFTLKDDQAQIRCVMWRPDAERLPIDPDEGSEIRVRGNLTLYEARGDYQLVVRRLEAVGGDGLWRLAFEKLRRKLEAEGLLDASRKRPIPRFPRAVGVVTSPTGAAFHDVLTVIRRRAPWTRVVLRGCRVQGDGSAVEIAEAVRCLSRSGLVDVLIVGRGGGSIEDLWAFNEEPVARALAACPIPVISAVGHEVDVTIADLVADVRAATPSAGAEAAVQDGVALRAALGRLPERLERGLRRSVARRREGLTGLERRLGAGTRSLVRRRRERLERGRDRLGDAARRDLADRGRRLEALAGRLDALSPLSTLRRGYAVPLDETGGLLRGVEAFAPDQAFRLRVANGRVHARVTEVERLGPASAAGPSSAESTDHGGGSGHDG